jgi:hypothetical protein
VASSDGLTTAVETTRLADYLEVCQGTFRDHLEANRIDRYCDLIIRDSATPIHIYRLAKACLDGGNLALWRQGVALALAMPHDTPRSRCDRGDARLRLGEWSAWEDLESLLYHPDWGISNASMLSWTRGRWDGTEDLSRKTLLVMPVGGLGDAIWSMRFVESIAARARHVIWDTAPSLSAFVRHNVGQLVRVVSLQSDFDEAECDRYTYAMSLPHIVGTVPPFVRRCAPAPHVAARHHTTRLRIGLAWSCSLDGHDHLERSLPLSVIAPLFWRSDIEWVSLQVGPRAADANYYPALNVADPPLRTVADTANIMAGLDGVIAVDTSVCHLAGVLGVPTLTLLRFPCEVKWGLGERSMWYPAMRLIRQPSRWDWSSVVAAVRAALDSNWWFVPSEWTADRIRPHD